MPLTDVAIRNAKPGAKPVKMFDEVGQFSMQFNRLCTAPYYTGAKCSAGDVVALSGTTKIVL